MTKNIAFFASGSGSNVENITEHFKNNKIFGFPLIISNNPDAFVHERAKKLGIPSFTFSKKELSEGSSIIALLKKFDVQYIVLAGFLLKIPHQIIEVFPQRIINIHPALLPKYGGKGMYGNHVHKAVVEAGETESGITIHYVNENYDEGDIIFQSACKVFPSDTYEDVANKVHQLEYLHYPQVIERLWGE